MKKTQLSLVIACLLAFNSCSQKQEYKLVWEDDFNGAKSTVWTAEKNKRGGGNAEMQYYIPEAISIEMHPSGVSCLVLNAKKENYEGRPVTSARLNTRGKMAFTYGKLEARVHIPKTADGIWPAFWMLGDDIATDLGDDDSIDQLKEKLAKSGKVVWPRCGEIDILEMGHADGIKNGTQNRYFNGACHWGENFNDGNYPNTSGKKTADYDLQDGFHLFTLIWTPDSIKMYLDLDKYPDTKPYFEMLIAGSGEPDHPSRYFHKPFHLILNLAVGGYFTGIPAPEKYPATISDDCEQFLKITGLPADGTPIKMYVDYIRLYQRGDKGETFNLSK